MGYYFVFIRDPDGNLISENGASIQLAAGDVDVGNSRVLAASGSSSVPASATVPVIVNIIAKDSAGNVLTIAENCPAVVTGDPCPLVQVTFIQDSGFPTYAPVATVRKALADGVSFEVLFLQAIPGYYTVNVRFTRGSGNVLTPYGMYATPLPAPTLFTCQMLDTLGDIRCVFNEPTNTPAAQSSELGSVNFFDCSRVLDAVTVLLLG
jgi:hypothetical protein